MNIKTQIAKSRRRSVEQAQARVIEANEKLRTAVDKEFPVGAPVKVTHAKGEFYGYVIRQNYTPGYLYIVNRSSKLVSKRHWLDVEIAK